MRPLVSRMLLVLDNCAHVIDAVASLVVAIMRAARGVHILATSREPLRVEGEHVFRLGPLESPRASESSLRPRRCGFRPSSCSAIEQRSHDGFELRDEDATLVGEICRKLDGIPLAIELAAARVELLGLRELSGRLEEGLQVLKGGRRTALPHHRTMRATLDWSYGLLSPPEQTVLSRLAIFAGGFTLPAAAAVVGDADAWRRGGCRPCAGTGDEIVGCGRRRASRTAISTADDDARVRPREGQGTWRTQHAWRSVMPRTS